jgi:HlyD family secretion protein
MKTKMQRFLTMVGTLAVIALIGTWWLRHRAPHAPETGTAIPPPAVSTSLVREGNFTERIAAHGRVGPPAGSAAKLVFAGNGVLSAIDVYVGEAVHAGQPLASYRGASVARAQLAGAEAKTAATHANLVAIEEGHGTVQSDRAAAESALRQALAKVALDRAELSRQRQLLTAGVVAEKNVEAARAQLTLDEADVRADQARVRNSPAGIGNALSQARADYQAAVSDATLARRELENTTLRAPKDGVVMAVLKHVGEAVDPTTPVIEVGPPQTDVITLTVPGSNGIRVRRGDEVEFSVAGIDSERGSGRVTAVVPAVDPATQTTTVTVDGVPPSAAPGDAVNARIVIGRIHGIIVPATAVVQDPQSGKTVAFVQQPLSQGGSRFVMQDVQIGPSNDRSAIVRSGLRAGQRVATQGAFDLLMPGG